MSLEKPQILFLFCSEPAPPNHTAKFHSRAHTQTQTRSVSSAWNSIEQLCFWWVFPIFTLFNPERALSYLWQWAMAHVLKMTQSFWAASPPLLWLSQLDMGEVIHKGTLKHENELRIPQKSTCSARASHESAQSTAVPWYYFFFSLCDTRPFPCRGRTCSGHESGLFRKRGWVACNTWCPYQFPT